MAQTLEDRSDRMFARSADVAELRARARMSGLTAIIAGPQMGKTWLLTEVAREILADASDPFLVGFAEAAGRTPDLLLRAVSDLYQRWLENASAREHLLRAWDLQKDELLPGFAAAVGKIAGEAPVVGKLLGGIIDQALSGLIAANANLKSGRLTLPPLQYDQARDLVGAVAKISGRKIALCLDAWEHSSDPEAAAEPLGAFVLEADAWPHCHIFLTTRDEPEAIGPLKAVARSVSGTAELYYLADFAPDAAETTRLSHFLNAAVPATTTVSPATLVSLIDGCPGVIGRWTSKAQRETMRSEADLARIAGDAQAYRFSDLESMLDALKDDKRLLALRLAVLPATASRDGWNALRPTLLDLGQGKVLDEAVLDDLLAAEVLEAIDPPSFGHVKRQEAAIDWFGAKRPTLLRQQTGWLARRLASQIDHVDGASPDTIIAATALREMAAASASDPWPAALCCAAATLFGKPVPTGALRVRDWLAQRGDDLPGALLVAMGLVNATYFAVEAGARPEGEILLDTLHALALRRPDDLAVHAQLINGLGHLYDLAALRRLFPNLCANYGERAVTDLYARKLFDAFDEARQQDRLVEMTESLDALRKMAADFPQHDAAQIWLGRALYNALRRFDEKGDAARTAALLGELQALADASPSDPDLAEVLARGLYQLGAASALGSDAQRAALIHRLHVLAKRHAGNDLIARMFAQASREAPARRFAHFGPPSGG